MSTVPDFPLRVESPPYGGQETPGEPGGFLESRPAAA